MTTNTIPLYGTQHIINRELLNLNTCAEKPGRLVFLPGILAEPARQNVQHRDDIQQSADLSAPRASFWDTMVLACSRSHVTEQGPGCFAEDL